MVGAVVAGDELARVAEIASSRAGAPVAVIVRLGSPVEAWASYERYVASRLAGGRPEAPAGGHRRGGDLVRRARAGRRAAARPGAGRGRGIPAHGGDRRPDRGGGGRSARRDRAVPARLIPRGGAGAPRPRPHGPRASRSAERRLRSTRRLHGALRRFEWACTRAPGGALVAEAPGVLAPADAGQGLRAAPGDRRSPDARPPGSGATPPLGSRPTTRARRTSGARSRRRTRARRHRRRQRRPSRGDRHWARTGCCFASRRATSRR